MGRIRGKNTSPELELRRALFSLGLRYRIHFKTPAGRVDIAFPAAKLAVQVDGCFWHGCPDHYVRPRSRAAFWAGKLQTNVDRDARQWELLAAAGWRLIRLWEHEVEAGPGRAAQGIQRLVRREVKPRGRLVRARRALLVPGNPDEVRLDLVDLADPRYRRSKIRQRSATAR